MKNESLIRSWIEFADMDANMASFTFENMHPKPLELICYHCQQAAEKILKTLLIVISENEDVQKTHDLALLADSVSETIEISDTIYNACSDLTPYGVRVRYPKEVFVDETMTQKALNDMTRILEWGKTEMEKLMQIG